MPNAEACPKPQDWPRIARWKQRESEFERLAAHVEGCNACALTVDGLTKDDTVAEALRAKLPTLDAKQQELIDTVISELMKRAADCSTVTEVKPRRRNPGSTWSVPLHSTDVKLPHNVDTGTVDEGQSASDVIPQFKKLGRFEIGPVLGIGGMGVVYEGLDTDLKRKVAVKVLSGKLSADEKARKRFLRESKHAAAVKSENVVIVHDVGMDNGVPYQVMEYLEGWTLEQWLQARTEKITDKEILWVAREALCGLAAAHEQGLIHRDVKPSNLWVMRAGKRLKILDFGLARETEVGDTLTSIGAVVGTPPYMAPEQIDGDPEMRSDLFSLGVTLYRMDKGASPFLRKKATATLNAIANFVPPPLDGVSAEVNEFIARLLAKNPYDRPKNAVAALAELDEVERKLREPKTKLAEPPKPPRPRTKVLVAAAWASLAVVLFGVTIVIYDRFGRRMGSIDVPDDPKGTTIAKVGVTDNKSGKTTTVKVGDDKPEPKMPLAKDPMKEKAPPEPSSDKIAVGSRVMVDVQTRGYLDPAGNFPVFVNRGITGKVQELTKITDEGQLCLVRFDEPVGELRSNELWLSVDRLKLLN